MNVNNTKKEITSFTGQYSFLSNFDFCIVSYKGEKYITVEHAFQAAKTQNLKDRKKIQTTISPGHAKRIGQKVVLINNWELYKLYIMEFLLVQKFVENEKLLYRLIATDKKTLTEFNAWHDNYWGVCICIACQKKQISKKDSNHLGKLLMKIRKVLLKHYKKQ